MNNNTSAHFPKTEISRDFKGIWIPREIWLNSKLLPLEKMLWAEIHSLFNRKKQGCYASNQYLSEFFGVSERYIREMISKLKNLGFVREVSFDGRIRVIMAVLPPEDFSEEDEFQPERNSSSGQTGTTVPVSPEPQFLPPIYIDNKDEGIDYTPPTPKGESVGVVSPFSKKSKKKKAPDKEDIPKETYLENVLLTKEQYSNLLALHGEKDLKWMIEILSAYIGSSGKQYKSHYHLMNSGGWVCNRLKEEKEKNSNPIPASGYQRKGKLVIEADRRCKAAEIQHVSEEGGMSDEECEAFLAKLRAEKEAKR